MLPGWFSTLSYQQGTGLMVKKIREENAETVTEISAVAGAVASLGKPLPTNQRFHESFIKIVE